MDTDEKIKRIPYLFAKKHGVVATEVSSENKIILYHLPGIKMQTIAEVKRVLNCEIQLKLVNGDEFQHHLSHFYQSQSAIIEATESMEDDLYLMQLATKVPNSEDLLDSQNDAPIIKLINALFTQAIKQKASDIHIETYENKVLIRNRLDGVLHEILEIQPKIAPFVISRVKVMAKLDIAEKRIPQDGRISLKIGGHNIDVRVSTLPSNHGERIVLRILDKKSAQLDLSLLGMPNDTLKKIKKMISEPHGILLVTGPTGSGKTTSLYAMLTELNEVTRNILTIEDPIEYDLPGIGQTQVNSKVNMTFARGLKAILRQDPDVVMIGEIRDIETSEIAIQASLTGHLVLSTLHTNSALGALTRLKDMGVESFLLSSSIIGVLAQRLVRKLCGNCKTEYELNDDEISILQAILKDNEDIPPIYKPNGCESCNFSGYKGRTGIYELIPVDETLQGMIHRQESLQTMEEYIRPTVTSIREDGCKRVLLGETSITEILRVTSA
ncbi:MAG: type II secretion system protein GspE [Legionellales bacterium RIFCSPHIGHO2_12_FULL_35_11]|nr:MAG: type II secretion system protein GspE [Legionellales bacterium RIFCSPHIGHO2_12_FULL_35_11]